MPEHWFRYRGARSGWPHAPSETPRTARSENHDFCLVTLRMNHEKMKYWGDTMNILVGSWVGLC